MRVMRAMGGALLWILASVVSLVALILCVTVVLLPLGIPLLLLGKRLFGQAIRLFLPPGAAHPLKTTAKASKSAVGDVVDALGAQTKNVPHPDAKSMRKRVRGTKKKLKKVASA